MHACVRSVLRQARTKLLRWSRPYRGKLSQHVWRIRPWQLKKSIDTTYFLTPTSSKKPVNLNAKSTVTAIIVLYCSWPACSCTESDDYWIGHHSSDIFTPIRLTFTRASVSLGWFSYFQDLVAKTLQHHINSGPVPEGIFRARKNTTDSAQLSAPQWPSDQNMQRRNMINMAMVDIHGKQFQFDNRQEFFAGVAKLL